MKYNEVTRTRVSEVLSVSRSGPTGFVRSANCCVAGGRDNVHMLETRNVVEGGRAHTQVICVGWGCGMPLLYAFVLGPLLCIQLFWGWKGLLLLSAWPSALGRTRAWRYHTELIKPLTRPRIFSVWKWAFARLGSFLVLHVLSAKTSQASRRRSMFDDVLT